MPTQEKTQENTRENTLASEPLYIRMRDEDNVAVIANRGGLYPGAVFADGLKLIEQIPQGHQWQYEPKWDGFRCLVFRDGDKIELQSKSGQSLTRYFPELIESFSRMKAKRFVLDGEIAVPVDGHFSFDDLLQRIHPAESRVRKLAREHPAWFIAFDLLVKAIPDPQNPGQWIFDPKIGGGG